MVVDEQSINENITNTNIENQDPNDEVSLNSRETEVSELTDEDEDGEESIGLETSEDEEEGEEREEEDSFQSLPKDIETIKDVILSVNISTPEIFDYSLTLKNHFMNSNQTDEMDLSLLENEIVRWQTGAVGSSSGGEDNEDSDPEEEQLPEPIQESEQAPQRAKRREHYDMLDDFIDDSEAPKPSVLTDKDLKYLKMKNFTTKSLQGAFKKLTLKKPIIKGLGNRQRSKPQSTSIKNSIATPITNTNGGSKSVKDKGSKQMNIPNILTDQGKMAIIGESGSDELSDLTTWTPSPPPALHHQPNTDNSLLPARRALSPSAVDRDGNNSKLSKSKKSRISNPSLSTSINVLTGPAKRKAITGAHLSHIQNIGKSSKLPISSAGPNLLNGSDSDTSTLSDLSTKDIRNSAKSPIHKPLIIESLNTKPSPARSNRIRTNRIRAPSNVPNRQATSISNVANLSTDRPNHNMHNSQDLYNHPQNPIVHAPPNASNLSTALNSTKNSSTIIKDSNSPDRRQKLSSIASLLSSDPPTEDTNRQQSYKSSFIKSVQSSIEYMLNDPSQNLPPSIQNQVQESIQQNGGVGSNNNNSEHRGYTISEQPLINNSNGDNLNSQQSSNSFQPSNNNGQNLAVPSVNRNQSTQNSPSLLTSSSNNNNSSNSTSISPSGSRSQLVTEETKPSPTKKSTASRRSTIISQATSRLTRSNSKKAAQSQIYTYVISDED